MEIKEYRKQAEADYPNGVADWRKGELKEALKALDIILADNPYKLNQITINNTNDPILETKEVFWDFQS